MGSTETSSKEIHNIKEFEWRKLSSTCVFVFVSVFCSFSHWYSPAFFLFLKMVLLWIPDKSPDAAGGLLVLIDFSKCTGLLTILTGKNCVLLSSVQ